MTAADRKEAIHRIMRELHVTHAVAVRMFAALERTVAETPVDEYAAIEEHLEGYVPH